MKDGLVLMYLRDDILYPVALTNEQVEVFKLAQQLLPQPIRIIENKPLGKAVNLVATTPLGLCIESERK